MALESVGGRQTFFGALPTINKYGEEVASSGLEKELRWTFNYDDLPAADSANDMLLRIPGGKEIVSGKIVVNTAMTGTTGTLTIGVSEQDGGGVIDADGIDAAVAQAVLIADAVITADGALIGTKLSEDGVVTVATGGTVTGGQFTLILNVADY